MAQTPLVHPLLASRWSPVAFDSTHVIEDVEIDTLLEAARWAPSAGNSQPWAFIVGRRGDEVHGRMLDSLAGSSRPWAPTASLLVVNLCRRYIEGTDWAYSDFAQYDLGQAVAHMIVQGQAMGLAARQFRAFDQGGLVVSFGVPSHWEVTTMTAFGVPAEPTPGRARRPRRGREDLRWHEPIPGTQVTSQTTPTMSSR